jgi:hypothetical protein
MTVQFNPHRRASYERRAALQDARREELAQLRRKRGLTAEEADEADRLDQRFYMRVYRRQRAERFGHAEALRRPRTHQGAIS